jgi:hypothetical protein
MKFKLTLAAFLLMGIRAYSQQKNTIALVYGVSNADVNIHGAIGDYGYNPENGMLYGITYSRVINKYLSLETGFLYSDDKAELNYIEPGLGTIFQNGEVKSVSVPLIAKFTFLKYIYLDAGFSYDKQTNYNSNSPVVNDQSGLGSEIGIGGQFIFSGVTVFINPYFSQYNITVTNNNLYETGVKFGLGYSF